jgi:hypothetical protein
VFGEERNKKRGLALFITTASWLASFANTIGADRSWSLLGTLSIRVLPVIPLLSKLKA